jgi:hypothetical protein
VPFVARPWHKVRVERTGAWLARGLIQLRALLQTSTSGAVWRIG